ncbi:multicopper oxidase family protein [Sorangium atrum]|uniref:Multicopper oxidase n=1 Tax=Sorangium atrum TaxID=2995308 RepID=A0ABT5BVL1_9BACT|nr:multicopper oxidase [Sorangium aterium]MDC0678176.1 multicopper oxidase [Sorangium aterium]
MKRRELLKHGLAATGGLLVLRRGVLARASLDTCTVLPPEEPTLAGTVIAQYQYRRPLLVPPVMPKAGRRHDACARFDYYEIAVRQFEQQVLPPELGLSPTKVWGYGSIHHPETFSYPAFTIEARYRRPVRVKWINELKDPATGRFLPHLLPVDPTLHWANPPGGVEGRDSRPTFPGDCPPGPYPGPVPIVTHLHGMAGVAQESDGYPEAWFLPAASDIPEGYAETGTFYDYYQGTSPLGDLWERGAAVFEYPNDQRAATLWYHDHTLGITRLNVYAGPAGFYLLRGGPGDLPPGVLPGSAPPPGHNHGCGPYEIPIVIQDRSFNDDGSLFYPKTRGLPPELANLYVPNGPFPPIWVPEFFGEVIVVNGRPWPYLEVEQRRYRFRILNGSDSRFLILKMDDGRSFWQIGSDSGFLPRPVERATLLLAPAERADVIVDFSDARAGTEIILLNRGPDVPFNGGAQPPADPATTGQVMQFRVVRATGRDTSTPPSRLRLPRFEPLGDEDAVRRVSLNELSLASAPEAGPLAVVLGTFSPPGSNTPKALFWDDPITENPAPGSTEIWEIYNFTMDAHPIHIHEVLFQVVERQPFATPPLPQPPPRPPEAGEEGFKDTVVALPLEITRIKAKFEKPGRFVWHCHILEHEDNEMMRPYQIGHPPPGIPTR